jgi:hypothetical protein
MPLADPGLVAADGAGAAGADDPDQDRRVVAMAAMVRLILAEQLGCRASPRPILEIDIGKLLSVVVADNEAGGLFFKRTRVAESGGFRALDWLP